MQATTARHRRLELLLAAGVIVCLLAWGASSAAAWWQVKFRPPVLAVQTSGLGGCLVPPEGETLVVFVVKREERIAFRCQYITTRERSRPDARGVRL